MIADKNRADHSIATTYVQYSTQVLSHIVRKIYK